MRAVAELLREQGFYTLALRMPGHGTCLRGLTRCDVGGLARGRADGRAARAAAIGPIAPLILVGYSNGGALAVKYTLEALDGRPAIRAVAAAPAVADDRRHARGAARLVDQPAGRRALLREGALARRAAGIQPVQVQLVPRQRRVPDGIAHEGIAAGSREAAGGGPAEALPPVLTFQSAVDATVSTAGGRERAVRPLPANGSELVLFDVNHQSGIDVFLSPPNERWCHTCSMMRHARIGVRSSPTPRRPVPA